jgi:hypothetical protein
VPAGIRATINIQPRQTRSSIKSGQTHIQCLPAFYSVEAVFLISSNQFP